MKILVISLLYIGDLLLTTPFIRALREALPEAVIDMVIEADYQDILRYNPNINRLIPIRRADFRGKIQNNLAFVRQIRREHYDICINLHHMKRTTLFTALSGARVRGGVYTKDLYGSLFTHHHKLNLNVFIIDAYLEILDTLGIKRKQTSCPLELYLGEAAPASAARLWKEAGLEGRSNLIGINPSSQRTYKRWSTANFTELARLLHGNGYEPVFFGGPADVELVNRILAMLDFTPISFAGKTSLLEAAALIAKCAVFVSNDSAPVHFAAAQNVPVVGIFGPTDPVRYHPYCENYRAISAPDACPKQRTCDEQTCKTLECLQKITAAEVFRAVQELIQ